jgi:hypothetical protein
MKGALEALVRAWPYAAAAMAAGSLSTAIIWWLLLRRRARQRRAPHMAYTLFDSPERRRVFRAFARAERALASNGFRRRRRNEPFGEYAASAQQAGIATGLERLAAYASRAAYSASPLPIAVATEAEDAARQLKAQRLPPSVSRNATA